MLDAPSVDIVQQSPNAAGESGYAHLGFAGLKTLQKTSSLAAATVLLSPILGQLVIRKTWLDATILYPRNLIAAYLVRLFAASRQQGQSRQQPEGAAAPTTGDSLPKRKENSRHHENQMGNPVQPPIL